MQDSDSRRSSIIMGNHRPASASAFRYPRIPQGLFAAVGLQPCGLATGKRYAMQCNKYAIPECLISYRSLCF